MITFAEHQVRAGKAGAPRDFEQMLGLLVRATSGKDATVLRELLLTQEAAKVYEEYYGTRPAPTRRTPPARSP